MTRAGTARAAPAGGVAPGAARPRDVREVRDAVREAAGAARPLRLHGAGTWLTAGRPVHDGATTLALSGVAGIVEYVPGDLTLTARAGTPLAEVARVTAAERQWLALEPFGSIDGTLGATVATASAGPLAHAFGGVRDNVLGLEAVTGTGEIIRGGGRVVKNVAGFDLVRLLSGAWGTLGVITEVTIRLRALPEADETLVIELPQSPALVRRLLDEVRHAPLLPLALELCSATLAARMGHGDRPVLAARLAGNAELVRAQHDTLSSIGATERATPGFWQRLATMEPADAAVIRWSHRPASLPDVWAHALAAVERADGASAGGFAHASAGRGVARIVLPCPADASTAQVAALGAALGIPFEGTCIAERLPAALWPVLARDAVTDRLSVGVRHAFDPQRLLNPGLLGTAS